VVVGDILVKIFPTFSRDGENGPFEIQVQLAHIPGCCPFTQVRTRNWVLCEQLAHQTWKRSLSNG